jgi:hypothetical protein
MVEFPRRTRKPSCLISISHSGPMGGCLADMGRHGGTKPVRDLAVACRLRLVPFGPMFLFGG